MTLKNKILELRNKNYSYSQIQKELNCSKATICYYCGSNQKEKTLKRNKKYQKLRHPLCKKIEFFLSKYKNKYKSTTQIRKTVYSKIKSKIKTFSTINGEYQNMSFTVDELLNKIGNDPICGLTGRSIDLNLSKTYQLDHIIPKSKGGDNSINNCRLTCREANVAKNDMTDEEFIQLCYDVVKHNNKI